MKEAFQIPHIDEVRIHIKAKRPEWPDKFIDYYADRFWMHYQSNGWLVSGKAKMKDWKAAFASQWQVLKYQEDKEMLAKTPIKKEIPKIAQPGNENVLDVDIVLNNYKKHPAYITKQQLASCWQWIKTNGFMNLTEEEKEIALKKYQEDKLTGKAIAVQFIFDRMAMKLLTFSEMMANV